MGKEVTQLHKPQSVAEEDEMSTLQRKLMTAIMIPVAIMAWSVMGVFAWGFVEHMMEIAL